jgi:hypothetical protein
MTKDKAKMKKQFAAGINAIDDYFEACSEDNGPEEAVITAVGSVLGLYDGPFEQDGFLSSLLLTIATRPLTAQERVDVAYILKLAGFKLGSFR